jgi:hypothetical protein
MYSPQVKSARPRRRYRLGNYQARLLDQVEAIGPIRYLYLLVLLAEGDPQPRLFVASEESDMPPSLGPQPPFLGIFDPTGHYNLGSSSEWADFETFAARALAIAAQHVGVNEPPEEIAPEP